jgi:hypothetical protein
MRTHRERMRLFRLMEASARSRNLTLSAARWQKAAIEAGRMAEQLEQAILTLQPQPDAAGDMDSSGPAGR